MTEPPSTSVPTTEPPEPFEPFTVAFTLTLDDYVETLLWMRRRPDMQTLHIKRVLIGALCAAPTIALAIVAVAWSAGVAWRQMAPAVVLVGVFGGLGGAFIGDALTRRWLVRRQLIKQLSATRGVDTSDGRYSQSARITLTEQGVENWTLALEQRRPWNTLFGLDETETLLLPRTDQARWIVIPKRDLPPETIDRLRCVIRQQLGLS